jgi:serine-type D-Ala-D-Ala carboxypeptidase (penicillin-binding protein 5/6)
VTEYEQHDGLSELWSMLARDQQSQQATPPVEPEHPPVDAPTRTRRRRIRRLVGLIAAVLILALAGTYVFLTLSAPVGAAASAVHRPNIDQPAAAALVLPTVGESAVSISGADDYLGPTADGIFASSGGNAALPMASISKLVTAMVVLNSKPLGASGTGPTITFDKADEALYDKYFALNATIAAMPTGSTMSEHDAIETMLVVSACNYAEAVADWAFGSEAGFLSAAHTWLRAHGLNSTTMVEPTGVDARNRSTPSDLIALGKLAMADPAIASIVAKTSLDVPSLAGMPSTNDLLGRDGIDGIKTGTLVPGGSDLLFSADVTVGAPTALRITGVMLAGTSRSSVDSAVDALITSITAGFHTVDLADAGQVVGSYSTPWGARASMVLGKGASTLTWSNAAITSTMTTTTLKTGANGEKVGSVTWVAGKNTITVPILLHGRIKGPSAWWRLTHPLQLTGK